MTSQQAMDAAILLKEGQKLAIAFSTKSECESFRIQLYRERTKMQGLSSLVRDEARKIMISRHRHPTDGRYFIFVTKECNFGNACIINKDGTISEFTPPAPRTLPSYQDVFPLADITWDNIPDDEIPDLSIDDDDTTMSSKNSYGD